MKGSHLDRLGPDQFGHPPPHLVGSLVREGQGNDLGRRHAGGDQVGDAAGHHPRLAAARPCQHQQRPLDVRRRRPLGLVETVEKVGLHGGFP